MKKFRKILLITGFLFSGMCMFHSFADEPLDNPPPPPGGGHGGGGNTQGAPIDEGLGVLLVLGAGYGGISLYRNRKISLNEKLRKVVA